MAYQSTAIDPGATPSVPVFNDSTANGDAQCIKLIDPTPGSVSGIGTDTNPMRARPPATLGYHAIAAATTNAATIKNAPALLFAVHVFNNATYPVFVKLYDKTTTPVPASDTPHLTIGVQGGTQRDVVLSPESFPTGLGIAMVKNIADNDNTALAVGDCAVDVEYGS